MMVPLCYFVFLIQKMPSSVHFLINDTFVMADLFKSGCLLLATSRNVICVDKFDLT